MNRTLDEGRIATGVCRGTAGWAPSSCTTCPAQEWTPCRGVSSVGRAGQSGSSKPNRHERCPL